MNLWIQMCFVAVFMFLNFFTVKAQSLDLMGFEWILGKWERTDTKIGQQAFEEWTRLSDSLFSGKGWIMEARDTVFIEDLRIFASGNRYFYEAVVAHNRSPVRFEIVKWDHLSFESINPKHDFPTNIDYEYDEADNLKARISNSKREVQFLFRKLRK
ncbi:MAG: hypothetical protein IPL46_33190 [Saprospiraceae bacterium]|nr:hypothetical protein [Saprospiraceae bacterium]